jgi:hypothetical protein
MSRGSGELDLTVDPKSGLISLLRIPAIDLYIFAVVSTAICIGFLSAVRTLLSDT